MLSLRTNLTSLLAQSSLRTSSNKLNQAIERMTTGFKINNAKDNAANYSISTNLTTQLGAYEVAERNTATGLDLVTTASEALSLLERLATRLRTLTEQASNGTYGESSRSAMQSEADSLIDEMYRIKNSVSFSAQSVLGEEEQTTFVKPTISISEIDDLSTVSNSEIIGISTAEELQKLGTFVDAGQNTTGKTFVLTNDIDLSSIENFNPIGDGTSVCFRGTFDGNGCVILNLNINASYSRVGLFTVPHNTSTIKNVTIVDANVTGREYVGILCGSTPNIGKITNCRVEGIVSGINYVGGLAGGNSSGFMIENCSANVNVTATTKSTGGLLGYNYGTIKDCFAEGTVKGNNEVGGLVGMANNTNKISNSWADVKVTGTGSALGALVGISRNTPKWENNYYNSATNGESMPAVGSGATITDDQIKDIGNDINNFKYLKKVDLQVGIHGDTNSGIAVDTGFELGVFGLYLMNETSARNGLSNVDRLLARINAQQTKLGAAENRLMSALEEISIKYENLASTRSTIRDADISEVSSQYIQQQILQQASSTLLATANQSPDLALRLIVNSTL